MFRKFLITSALVLGSLLGMAAPASAATPHNYAGCNNHLGVEYATHLAYLCVNGGKGTLYWTQYLYTFEYYWHPSNGDMVVTEVYFKPPGSVWLGEEPLVTPVGLPLPPRSNGRLVILADGCIVSAPVLDVVPTFCLSTDHGGQSGSFHQMTPVEQNSVRDFWTIMFASVPDNAW